MTLWCLPVIYHRADLDNLDLRAAAALAAQKTRSQIQKHGRRGILMMDQESKMETVTTMKAAFVPPKSLGVRLRGARGELLEKHITEMIREKVHAELNPTDPSLETDYCSTTQKDFCVEGFVPHIPETTQVHDYKTDQAVSFWSENCHRIQGATAVQNLKAPFRKSTLFSTPIGERLDEIELPPDN
ncbi:sperm-associated antigen 8 isoform X2 [Anarrhichthys ocellatus]|uniref:sperm-associated antigen 8 isoform X2 n=1 Tax=Anarrhichthys ocellatus TaxID=433405 RepID=UPI0012EEA8FB|nr:sperm-associated antigen 8-like isoform X2 [Anarrhichthys ocellatus]